MTKKILYTIVGALILAAIIALLWLWLRPEPQSQEQAGTFGTADDRGAGAGSGGFGTNLGSSINEGGLGGQGGGGPTGSSGGSASNVPITSGGSSSGTSGGVGGGVGVGGGTVPGGVGGAGAGVGTGVGAGGTAVGVGGGAAVTPGSGSLGPAVVGGGTSTTTGGVDGVTWVDGGTSGNLSGPGRDFTPSEINQLSSASGGLPLLSGNQTGAGQGGIGLGDALLAAGITGSIVCGAKELFATGALTAGTAAGVAATKAVATAGVIPSGLPTDPKSTNAALSVLAGFVVAPNAVTAAGSAADQQLGFAACILNTLAKVALQQMTASIVNWINSGFNGKPGFVQNYTQFFTNVADQAAGEFIRGSGLAFLCSPFRPQVRIAIAKAYANRGAQSCSLTSITRNAQSFMNGNFSAGGWPGFLTYTTMPINNPYGSYAYAQISLGNYQAQKVAEQATRVQLGQGFLPVTKEQECTILGINPDKSPKTTCKEVVVTPGTTVARAIDKQLGIGTDQLGLANSIDQILSALVTQLMTRALYEGLASSNNSAAVSNAQQQALAKAQALLNEMQELVNIAQQYGSIKQGAIRDIQQAQQNLNSLYNCWNGIVPPTAQSAANASSTQAKIDELEARVDLLNGQITAANDSIATIQELQTELALAKNPTQINAVEADLNAAKASGAFLTQSDVTLALQDRETLQAEMTALNNQTNAEILECSAL